MYVIAVLEFLSFRLTLAYPECSSNGGVFGSLFGTPIINLPQSAVFGASFFSIDDDVVLS